MKNRGSLSRKIILLVGALLLAFGAVFCGLSISRSRVAIRKAIRQRMVDIANCAAGSVNGNTLASISAGDEGTPGYQAVYDSMAVFRDNAEVEYVYAIRDEGNGRFTFIVDTDPEEPGAFGSEVKYTEALARAAQGKTAVDEVPYKDQWGEFYSAYSPVFDSAGRVAGIVAADFSGAWFDAQLQEQTTSTVYDSVILLVVTLAAAAVLCILAVRPFIRMQEQLLEEKVNAEGANRAKSDFLASMSHEIRTPINAMLGMNEMILRESRQGMNLPAGQTQEVRGTFGRIGSCARDAERAGHSLLGIINDILDFSRIEAGRLELAEARYRLSSLLEDVSSLVRIRAREKELEYILQADESLPEYFLGDEKRVREVLANVLHNAVKYTDHGFVRFSVRSGGREGDTVRLVFTVEDSGIGIRQKDQEKLFSPFERLDLVRNSTVEGSGLGLAITRSLVEMMNGTISVESEYGKGSAFTICIPQKIAPDTPETGDSPGTEDLTGADPGESFRAPEARILIVDDTKMNRIVTAGLLKHTGIRTDLASGGVEALSLAEQNTYDLILMDQRVPEMDGTEALHRLRQLKNNPNRDIPVLCLTADAILGAKERYLAEGFTDYLTKPVTGAQLEAALLKYLPPEKIFALESDSSAPETPDTPDPGDPYGPLRCADVRPETGLTYCSGDAELYLSILREYALSAPDRRESLQAALAAEDWQRYGLLAHSLKSTSRTIGADALAGMAAVLEKAAKEGDADRIRLDHDAVLDLYRLTADAAEETSGAVMSAPVPEDGILEFPPAE